MLIIIDNYDSFTYNLSHYFQQLGQEVHVYTNDAITVAAVLSQQPDYIVISPGPGRPEDAGISLPLIAAVAGRIPLLGVCLGHQAIAQAFGARIVTADVVMHGKTSLVFHQDQGMFKHLANPLQVMRYHSLVVDPATLSAEFMVTGWTERQPGMMQDIMAIQHQSLPIFGVQFHPESILTLQGHELLRQFLTNAVLTIQLSSCYG